MKSSRFTQEKLEMYFESLYSFPQCCYWYLILSPFLLLFISSFIQVKSFFPCISFLVVDEVPRFFINLFLAFYIFSLFAITIHLLYYSKKTPELKCHLRKIKFLSIISFVIQIGIIGSLFTPYNQKYFQYFFFRIIWFIASVTYHFQFDSFTTLWRDKDNYKKEKLFNFLTLISGILWILFFFIFGGTYSQNNIFIYILRIFCGIFDDFFLISSSLKYIFEGNNFYGRAFLPFFYLHKSYLPGN